jgi:hypothetical protein
VVTQDNLVIRHERAVRTRLGTLRASVAGLPAALTRQAGLIGRWPTRHDTCPVSDHELGRMSRVYSG